MALEDEDFIKSCYEDSDIRYFIDVDAEDLKQLYKLCNNLSSLPAKKIKIEKFENLCVEIITK